MMGKVLVSCSLPTLLSCARMPTNLEQLLLLHRGRSGLKYKWEELTYKVSVMVWCKSKMIPRAGLTGWRWVGCRGRVLEIGSQGETREQGLGKENRRKRGDKKNNFTHFAIFLKALLVHQQLLDIPQFEYMVLNPFRLLDVLFFKSKQNRASAPKLEGFERHVSIP